MKRTDGCKADFEGERNADEYKYFKKGEHCKYDQSKNIDKKDYHKD